MAQGHRGEGSSNQSSLPRNPGAPGLHSRKEPAARIPRIPEQVRRDITRRLDPTRKTVDNTAPAPREAIIAAAEALREVAVALSSDKRPRRDAHPSRSRFTEPEVNSHRRNGQAVNSLQQEDRTRDLRQRITRSSVEHPRDLRDKLTRSDIEHPRDLRDKHTQNQVNRNCATRTDPRGVLPQRAVDARRVE